MRAWSSAISALSALQRRRKRGLPFQTVRPLRPPAAEPSPRPAARIRRLTHAIHRCPGSASRGAGAKRCGTANSFGVCVTTSTARIKIEQHPAASPHLISTARATTPPGSPQSAGRLSVGLSQAVPLARYRRYRRSSARRCGAATCSSLPSRAEVPPARPTPRRVLFEQQHCYRCRAA